MRIFFKTFAMATSLLGVSVFAGDMTCSEQADAFSSKVSESKVSKLSSNCMGQAIGQALFSTKAGRSPAAVRKLSNPKMVDLNLDRSINSYAYANYIVLEKEPGKYKIYAGTKTGLNNVFGLTLSHDGEFVAALNKSSKGNEIVIFKTAYSGNVSPHKVIRGDELSEVDQITFGSKGDILYLNDSENKNIKTVETSKDSRKNTEEYKPRFTELLKLDEKTKISFIKSYDSSILALSGKFLFSYDEGLKKQNWVIDLGVIGLENPKGFQISKHGKEIEIYTQRNKLDSIIFPGK